MRITVEEKQELEKEIRQAFLTELKRRIVERLFSDNREGVEKMLAETSSGFHDLLKEKFQC